LLEIEEDGKMPMEVEAREFRRLDWNLNPFPLNAKTPGRVQYLTIDPP